MKRYLPVIFISVLALCSCKAPEEYRSPVPIVKPETGGGEEESGGGPVVAKPNFAEELLKGKKQKGQLGLADPFIFVDREDSVYYAFGTANPQKGYKAYVSPDLQRWVLAPGYAQENFALYKTDVMVTVGSTTYSDTNFWAPELYKVNGKYLMFYTAASHIYVAEAASPLGPFKQSSTGFTPDANGIDCSLFIDNDGAPYLYWVRFDSGNVIYAAKLDATLKAIKKETLKFCLRASQSWELSQGKITEGPTVFRRGSTYYMVYSANHYESQNYGVGVATASSPLGPWTKYDGPILQKPGSLVGTGHSSVFTDLQGNLRLVFHAHASTTSVQPRQTYFTSLSFVSEGGVEKLSASPAYTAMYLYQ